MLLIKITRTLIITAIYIIIFLIATSLTQRENPKLIT